MELWKDVKGYEGLYQVSDQGNVRSVSRTVLNKHGKPQFYPGKALKPDITQMSFTRYSRVTLSKGHTTKRFSVHRLVAEAFIPNPEGKPFVNHKNNDAQNNQVANLEWCTHAENMNHAQAQGRLFASQSKGGKIGGRVSAKVRQDTIDALYGTRVNDWSVLGDPPQIRGKKAYLLCRCKCGTEALQEVTRLNRAEVTCCRACSFQSRT